jgi:hypothetical protein
MAKCPRRILVDRTSARDLAAGGGLPPHFIDFEFIGTCSGCLNTRSSLDGYQANSHLLPAQIPREGPCRYRWRPVGLSDLGERRKPSNWSRKYCEA